MLTMAGSGRMLRVQAQTPRASLYVFVHTEAKSSQLESSLKESLDGLEVTVFGRFRDFEEAVAARRPDAILGLPPLLTMQRVPITLRGTRAGSDLEPYALLGTAASLDGALSDKVIGSVEILGRAGTTDLVKNLLKIQDIKLKRVTKLEDLLPLLQLSLADVILMPSVAIKGVSQQSRLPLEVRELPGGRVGLPAVGILNPTVKELMVGQFQKLDPKTNAMLRVERWETR